MSRSDLPITAVDQVARDKAQQALEEISGHEKLCAERYDNINETMKVIKSILGWAGGSLFAILIATLGWMISQQIQSGDRARQISEDRIELLQKQVAKQPAPQR